MNIGPKGKGKASEFPNPNKQRTKESYAGKQTGSDFKVKRWSEKKAFAGKYRTGQAHMKEWRLSGLSAVMKAK